MGRPADVVSYIVSRPMRCLGVLDTYTHKVELSRYQGSRRSINTTG